MTVPYSKFSMYLKVWFDENKRKMYPSEDEKKESEAIYTKWPKVGHLTLMANFWREKKLATKRTTPVFLVFVIWI